MKRDTAQGSVQAGVRGGAWRVGAAYSLAWLLVAAALFAPLLAAAEQDPAKANRLFTEAREKLKDDPEEALELLNQAEDYFAHPAILLLKAKTQRELGMLEAAEATLGRVDVGKLPRPLRKVHDEEAAAIASARKELGRLVVRVTPANAMVVVNKREFRGGYDRWHQPGEVRVEFLLPEYQPAVRTVTVEVGGKAELEVELVPLQGTIRVTVPGGLMGVDVLIDGKKAEIKGGEQAGDMVSFEVRLGKHEVLCRRGDKESGRIVEVAFGKRVDVRCEGVGAGPDVARLGLGWGGVAVGVGLAGYGVWGIQSYFADLEFAKNNGKIADSNKHYGGAMYLASGVAVGLASWWLLLREPAKDTGEGGEASAALLAPIVTAPGMSARF